MVELYSGDTLFPQIEGNMEYKDENYKIYSRSKKKIINASNFAAVLQIISEIASV
jgi:hypothetical protein